MGTNRTSRSPSRPAHSFLFYPLLFSIEAFYAAFLIAIAQNCHSRFRQYFREDIVRIMLSVSVSDVPLETLSEETPVQGPGQILALREDAVVEILICHF